jgi:hypothetical protein
MTHTLLRAVAAPLLALIAAGSLEAQVSAQAVLEPPSAKVAALDAALYNAQANLKEATDSAKAAVASTVLHQTLGRLLGGQMADSAGVAAAVRSAEAVFAGGQSCNVVLACARAAAKAVGARWVVLAKVSKTSNLIWLLTAQLVHVPTGTIVLDDSTELKGDPEAMVRVGTRIFAERVARTVRAGGVANDFPPAAGS